MTIGITLNHDLDYNMEPIKDTLANFTTITALGAVLMDWTNVITFFLVFTGVLLNLSRLYDWWISRDKSRVKKHTPRK